MAGEGLSWRIGDIKGQTGTRRLVKGVERRANKGKDTRCSVLVQRPRVFVICFQYFSPVRLRCLAVGQLRFTLAKMSELSFVVQSPFDQSRGFLNRVSFFLSLETRNFVKIVQRFSGLHLFPKFIVRFIPRRFYAANAEMKMSFLRQDVVNCHGT